MRVPSRMDGHPLPDYGIQDYNDTFRAAFTSSSGVSPAETKCHTVTRRRRDGHDSSHQGSWGRFHADYMRITCGQHADYTTCGLQLTTQTSTDMLRHVLYRREMAWAEIQGRLYPRK